MTTPKPEDVVKLLPCPFCGVLATQCSARISENLWHYITCKNKTCTSRPHSQCFKTSAEAIAAWNTRAAMPGYAAGIEAARTLVDQLARQARAFDLVYKYNALIEAEAEIRALAAPSTKEQK